MANFLLRQVYPGAAIPDSSNCQTITEMAFGSTIFPLEQPNDSSVQDGRRREIRRSALKKEGTRRFVQIQIMRIQFLCVSK